jgi:hypothetical protein
MVASKLGSRPVVELERLATSYYASLNMPTGVATPTKLRDGFVAPAAGTGGETDSERIRGASGGTPGAPSAS